MHSIHPSAAKAGTFWVSKPARLKPRPFKAYIHAPNQPLARSATSMDCRICSETSVTAPGE